MKKVILHIGRHKSGTTSVQNFLYHNRELLSSYGFYYPDTGIRVNAHHEIGESFSRQELKKGGPEREQKNQELAQKLHREIESNAGDIIISTESLQNCDPAVIRKLFEGYQVKIVVYLREQASYLTSAYAQKVQASAYSGEIQEFYENVFRVNYHDFLASWAKVFDNNLVVKLFEKASLEAGDVVYDFCSQVLGINTDDIERNYTKANGNPTLTADLLRFKLTVNANECVTTHQMRMLYQALSKVSESDKSGKILLDRDLLMRVREDSEEQNRKTARLYFNRDYLFAEKSDKCSDHPAVSSLEQSRVTEIIDHLHRIEPRLDTKVLSDSFTW